MKPFLTQFSFTAAQLPTIHATISLYDGLFICPVLLYSWMPPMIQFSHLARNWSLNGLLTVISRGWSFKYKKCAPTFQAIGYKRMMQPTQLIFQGQWTHKKSRYSSPVDHRSLDDLWPQITRWFVHKYIHNVTKVMCTLYVRCALSVLQKECRKVWVAHYTLGARYRSENTVIWFYTVNKLRARCSCT